MLLIANLCESTNASLGKHSGSSDVNFRSARQFLSRAQRYEFTTHVGSLDMLKIEEILSSLPLFCERYKLIPDTGARAREAVDTKPITKSPDFDQRANSPVPQRQLVKRPDLHERRLTTFKWT